MYTQAATAMTTMLATTTTATNDPSWLRLTLFFGLCLVWMGLTLWVYSMFGSDDRRTQMNIGIVMVVIGLLIALIGLLIWFIP